MPAPIALQLYTLREAAATDYEGMVRKVADIGYVGVEPAGFPGTTVEAGKRLFDELGLEVCSAHLPLPVGDKQQESLDTAAALGIERVVAGLGPDDFSTRDQIKASCGKFDEASANCVERGFTFGIHNHWWEFIEVDGELVYKQMLEHLAPEVFFQVDAYWVQTAGPDPASVIAELGSRAPLIHMKDGPCTRKDDMQALGEGVTDFQSIIDAGGDDVDWWIVELDRCATDMVEAVEKSYAFLTEGYARGR
ncbi:MAG: sugar phosphate isomerase/epimerase [Candidatus Latescibacterota bacterium]